MAFFSFSGLAWLDIHLQRTHGDDASPSYYYKKFPIHGQEMDSVNDAAISLISLLVFFFSMGVFLCLPTSHHIVYIHACSP